MSALALRVLDWCPPCVRDADFDLRLRAAFADGPVADHPEPVTPQPIVTRSDADRHDADAVRCSHLIDPKGTSSPWLRCVGRAGHTAPHWWSLVGEGAWQFVGIA